jgi:hypothetical protein
MRKHEVSYHDHSNNIFFLSDHCSHLDASEQSFSILSTQIKEMLSESRKKKNDFKLTRILKRDEKIEISLSIQRNQKNLTEIVIQSKKKKKKKKRKTKKSIRNESTDSKIYMIEAASFHLLIKQKKTEIFALFSRENDAQINATSSQNIDIQLSKIEKISIDSRTVMSLEYHDFLNVFFKQEANKLSSHRERHDHRIELKEKKNSITNTPRCIKCQMMSCY